MAAKNEAQRIGNVLKPICHHPLIGEIIVVCDGCIDNTAEIARSYGANVIEQKKSQGKALAVKVGLASAKYDTILLLDADLVGLTEKNVTDLVWPVLSGKVDFTLSIRGNSSHIFKLLGIDFCSGERVIGKELLASSGFWSQPKVGYGLEVLMNNSLLKRHKKFITVSMPNLHHLTKSQKMFRLKGWMRDIGMWLNIFRVFPFYKVIGQFIEMAYLNQKYHRQLKKLEGNT